MYTVFTPRITSVSSLYYHDMFRPSWAIITWLKHTIMTSKSSLGLYCSMGFAGYVAVCVQLYCRCFTVLHLVVTVYTICFGLYGHLQVCRVFSFTFLKESASLVLLARGYTFAQWQLNVRQRIIYSRAARRRQHNLQNPLNFQKEVVLRIFIDLGSSGEHDTFQCYVAVTYK
jgi:hypothetical protein